MSTNAGSTMLPLNSLLNPPLPDLVDCPSRQSSPKLSIFPNPLAKIVLSQAAMDGMLMLSSRNKTPRSIDNININKSKPQGPVNFPPFEDVGQDSLQELRRFRVSPFSLIHQCCEHIPYNSAKKDFFEKTGRESMEVFKYQFQLPEDDNRYTIMWDYNVGLVRMTPFFKCLGYAKTKPSQMLDKNLGLRDITPSVTGGAVSAQGYWMPYKCAKAVCATFCYGIAGALIPLFGPCFPSECSPPGSSGYKEMVISQQIIIETKREVELYRNFNKERTPPAPGMSTGHGKLEFRGKHTDKIFSVRAPYYRPKSLWSPKETSEVDLPQPKYLDMRGEEGWGSGAPSRTSFSSPFPSRANTGQGILKQQLDPLLSTRLQRDEGETPRTLALATTWRPKRRRWMRDSHSFNERGRTVAPDTEMRNLVKRPEQELDKFKAAAVLVSLHKETCQQQQAQSWSGAIVEFSDDDESSGPGVLHRRKRPKAHSF